MHQPHNLFSIFDAWIKFLFGVFYRFTKFLIDSWCVKSGLISCFTQKYIMKVKWIWTGIQSEKHCMVGCSNCTLIKYSCVCLHTLHTIKWLIWGKRGSGSLHDHKTIILTTEAGMNECKSIIGRLFVYGNPGGSVITGFIAKESTKALRGGITAWNIPTAANVGASKLNKTLRVKKRKPVREIIGHSVFADLHCEIKVLETRSTIRRICTEPQLCGLAKHSRKLVCFGHEREININIDCTN